MLSPQARYKKAFKIHKKQKKTKRTTLFLSASIYASVYTALRYKTPKNFH